ITGSESLHKAGIISDEAYQQAVTNLNDSYLSYWQARHDLVEVLNKTGIHKDTIELLKIGQTQKVQEVLSQPISNIKIFAKKDGVALKPISTGGSSSDSDKPIQVGSQVKEGQLLISLGDMSGISLKIETDEVNINNIKIGEKARVSSDAFPGVVL